MHVLRTHAHAVAATTFAPSDRADSGDAESSAESAGRRMVRRWQLCKEHQV